MDNDDSLDKFLTFQREVNKLFRRIFEEGTSGRDHDGDGVVTRANVSERKQSLLFEVETPGTPAESLTVWVSRDLVVVEGEKPPESRDGRLRFHCMERDFGRFRRVLEIPCPVDTRSAKAEYAAGVLSIELPKIELDRRGERRKVEITHRKRAPGKRGPGRRARG